MNKILCIYPKDSTTGFLEPLFEDICKRYSATPLLGDPQDDDDYLDKLYELAGQSDTIVFLGHGTSDVLYGVKFNELIHAYNVDFLRGKNLVLFACNSVGFIKKHKLIHALGFGIVPTSDYDAETGKLHSLPLKQLISLDIDYIQQAIVRIWQKTLVEADISDVRRFYSVFSYHINAEIVCCLKEKKQKNFRLIADILYYLKDDMDYIE
ncbi:MAG: hypothetical protein IKX65_06830 [Prevotella sp.]|nr:hypothetical protein [Prevotella sp.]